jgi:hypothetical protein
MTSQRKISSVQDSQNEMTGASSIRLKDAYELASRQASGFGNLSYTHIDYNNYLGQGNKEI